MWKRLAVELKIQIKDIMESDLEDKIKCLEQMIADIKNCESDNWKEHEKNLAYLDGHLDALKGMLKYLEGLEG